MKKNIFTLLALLVCAVGSAWGETTYKLIDRSEATPVLNNTDFRASGDIVTTGNSNPTVTFNEVDINGYIKFAGTTSSVTNQYATNKVFAYDCKTTKTDFKIYVYNTNSAAKNLIVSEIKEGQSEESVETIEVASKTAGLIKEYSATNTTSSTVYFCVASTNIQVYQIEAIESGTALASGGERGYEINLNKGKAGIASGTATTVDGIEYHLNANYAILNSTEAKIKTKGTNYIKFTTTVPTKFTLTSSNSVAYYITSSKFESETDVTGLTSYSGTNSLELAAGTWYVNPNGSEVKITKLKFEKPDVTKLTGAWSAPSGTIFEGDDVPTPSFSVTNDPIPSSSAYNVTYSLKAGSDAGVVTIPSGGASFTLNNNVVGTATIVATLTTTDDDVYEDAEETYEYVYTVNAKTPTITLNEDEISLKSTPVTRNASTTVTLTGAYLNNGTGTVTWTAVEGISITPTTFTIADGSANQEFTITYNKDVATSGSVDVTFSDGTTSKVLTVNYSSVVAHEWAKVNETTTWDWANLSSTDIQLTPETTPTKSEEFLLGDMNGENLSQNINYNPATFNADALKVITEFATRKQGSVQFMQGTQVRFQTSVPGSVQVWFSNTSNRQDTDGNRRYIYINDKSTGTYTLNTTMTESSSITVPAGIVTITANTGEGSSTMVRINKIVFTADGTLDQQAITISCEGGYASYSCDKALDFSTSNAKAYIIKATSENSATLTEVTKVPANTGIIVAGTKGETVNVLTTDGATDDVTGNLLKGTVNTPVAVDADKAYGLSKTDGKFHLLNAGTIPANKAYLLASEVFQASQGAAVLDLNFGETTGINMVNGSEFMVNGSDFYNLNGQRVAQPTKGLYIVNGRKVIIK